MQKVVRSDFAAWLGQTAQTLRAAKKGLLSASSPKAIIGQPHGPLNTRQAAAYVGLSASSLNKMRCNGSGPAYRKLGRRITYYPADLDCWLEQRRSTSTTDSDARLPRRLADPIPAKKGALH
jgi:hypothetical protein